MEISLSESFAQKCSSTDANTFRVIRGMKDNTNTTAVNMYIQGHRWVPKCFRTFGIVGIKAFWNSEKLLRIFSVGVSGTFKKAEFCERIDSLFPGEGGASLRNGESRSKLSLIAFWLVWTLPLSEGGSQSIESRSLRLKALVVGLCLCLKLCCL